MRKYKLLHAQGLEMKQDGPEPPHQEMGLVDGRVVKYEGMEYHDCRSGIWITCHLRSSQAYYNQIRAPPRGVNEGSVENEFPKRIHLILLLILPPRSEYVKCQAGRPTSYAMDANNLLKKGA